VLELADEIGERDVKLVELQVAGKSVGSGIVGPRRKVIRQPGASANALGLAMTPAVLAQGDEFIQSTIMWRCPCIRSR